jgi:carboxyl-terminal processing protease
MSLMDAVKAIRGPKGSKVILTLLRENQAELLDVSITRDLIPLRSVRYHILEDGYGYIRISHFQENTTLDMIKGLKELQSQKTPLKGLVLDLRNDPGGLLQEAVNVADQFLSEGLIVTTKGRLPNQNMSFEATEHTTAGNYPVICVVNNGSASASEIVAGALQDQGRALVMGTATFGKGSVQTIIPLQDDGALRLTTARYYTPKGRAIQAKGIAPDLVVPFVPPEEKNGDKEKKSQAIREKDLQGAMAPEDQPGKDKKSKPAMDKLHIDAERLAGDNQLQRALELLKAWQVFAPMAAAQQPH